MSAIDLNKLTEKQTAAAHKFLGLLKNGKEFTALDFPDLQEDEFENLADAIFEAMNKGAY